MKKLLVFAAILLLAGSAFARTPTPGNMWNVSDYDGVYGAELTTTGQLTPLVDDTGSLGTSTYQWGTAVLGDVTADTVATGTLDVTGAVSIPEVVAKCDTWDNLLAKSTCYFTGGSNLVITTATCVANKYYYNTGTITQPNQAPRNITIQFDGATGDGSGSYASFTIEGLDGRGNKITESGLANAGQFVSSYTFLTVYGTTFTITAGIDATLALSYGNGDYVGLLGDISATTKLYKAVVQTNTTKADETSSVTVSAAYDKWTHSDVPDGADDFYIFYRADSE